MNTTTAPTAVPTQVPTTAPTPVPTEQPETAKPRLWHFYCCPTTIALCGHDKPVLRGTWTKATEYSADDCAACVLEHQQWQQQPWNEHHPSCPHHQDQEG